MSTDSLSIVQEVEVVTSLSNDAFNAVIAKRNRDGWVLKNISTSHVCKYDPNVCPSSSLVFTAILLFEKSL